MIKQVTVFAASSARVAEKYLIAAEETAGVLSAAGVGIIYGGGAIGLMGRLADRVILCKGTITGIIPRFMIEAEWAHKGISRLKIVDTMHERKKAFLEDTDAVVALPGGTGTLEELFEVITLKRLGMFTRPIIIINTGGYYDPLFEMLEKMITEHFLRPEHKKMWTAIDHPSVLMDAIREAPGWDASAIKYAAV